MKLDRLHWLLISLLVATVLGVWITPYRYERWFDGGIVRIHRITGEADGLTRNGWRPLRRKQPQRTSTYAVDPAPVY